MAQENLERMTAFLPEAAHAASPGVTDDPTAPSEARPSGAPIDERLWRGLMAAALLLDVYPDAAWTLAVRTVTRDESALATLTADVRGALPPLRLLLMRHDGQERVLGAITPELGLLPARGERWTAADLPSACAWVGRGENGVMDDPCAYLDDRDRATLIRRLALLAGGGPAARFSADLAKAGLSAAQALKRQEPEAVRALSVRWQAVHGLLGVPAFDALTQRGEARRAGTVNPLLAALSLQEGAAEEIAEQQTWLWRGAPFARTSAALGLESAGAADGQALKELEEAVSRLIAWSPRFAAALADRLTDGLAALDGSRTLLPEARVVVEGCRDRAREAAQQTRPVVELAYPWREDDPAVRYLLREQLGDLADSALRSLTDRLVLIENAPAGTLGDPMLDALCRVGGCAAVPPVSPALAAAAPAVPRWDSLRFSADEAGAITVRLALEGRYAAVVVSRSYAPEAQTRLAVEDAPTVALWPGFALPAESWRAYYLCAQGGRLTAHMPCGDGWTSGAAARSTAFPCCVALRLDGSEDVGALPTPNRPTSITRGEEALVALDLGATGLAMAIRQGSRVEPVHGAPWQATLINGPARCDALSALSPLEPLLSSAVVMAEDGELPLRSGTVCAPRSAAWVAALPGDQLCCMLKWGVERRERQARALMLREAMLGASLVAALSGAPAIRWAVALPDAMAAAGRETLLRQAAEAAAWAAEETGLPCPGERPAVSWASNAAALDAYHRARTGLAGAYVAVDLGGGSIGLTARLRGLDHPAAMCHLNWGMQDLLLDALLARPELLLSDLADAPIPGVSRDARSLTDLLTHSGGSRRALDKARFLLDVFLGQYLAALLPFMNDRWAQGRITALQALLVGAFTMVMTMAGLLLEQIGQDATLNDRLPYEVSLCLTGRGSTLLASVPDGARDLLARFVRLPLDPAAPVRTLRLAVSDQPKLEVALGLTGCALSAAAPTPERAAAAPVNAAALPTRYLLLLRAAFPDVCEKLYPGLTGVNDMGSVTLEDADAVRAAVDRCFPGDSAGEAFAACVTALRRPA